MANLNHHSEMVSRSHMIAPGQAFFTSKAWESPPIVVSNTNNTKTRGLNFSDAHPARRAVMNRSKNVVVKRENEDDGKSPARKRQRTSSITEVSELNHQKILPEVKYSETQRVFSNLNAEYVAEYNKRYHNDTFWNQLSEWTILIQEMLRIAMFPNLSSVIEDSCELFERLTERLEILKQDIDRSTVDINRKIGRLRDLKHLIPEYTNLRTQMEALSEKLNGLI